MTGRFHALLVTLAAFLFTPPAAHQLPDTKIASEDLGHGIHLLRASSALDIWTSSNVVVIVNDQDVVVFDTATRPGTNRMVLEEIRRLTDKPVRTLINSHWHLDHWSGNAEFVKAFPGIQIVSTLATRDYMKRMGPKFFADEAGTGTLGEEMAALPRVLPTVAFEESLVFWSGSREFRLFSATGDATGCAVLYLPNDKVLVTGDVLVRSENGDGPPPWTTNSNAITPWWESLRRLDALDASVIVPGQGPALRDKAYLELTITLFASIVEQVHAALERGLVKLGDVQGAVNVEAIGRQYETGGAAPRPEFTRLVNTLVRKVFQESLDGAGREK